MDKPKVSVVMPVWNTPEEYLREAVESILTQTFSDFEFIIVDDGSTKHNVTAILESYRDERIILIKNKVNAGVSRARNLGMKKSRGDYVALMDADDVSYPERLQKEVDFLDRHPEIAMVSTGKRFIPAGRAEVPEFANGKLRDYLLFRGCFIQTGAVMMRRTVFEDYGLYFNPELDVAEDYDMWLRMLAYFNPANIYEPLYGYRRHGDNVSILKYDKLVRMADYVRYAALMDMAGLKGRARKVTEKFFDCRWPELKAGERKILENSLEKMINMFKARGYDLEMGRYYLCRRFKRNMKLCRDGRVLREMIVSPLAALLKVPAYFKLRMMLKILFKRVK